MSLRRGRVLAFVLLVPVSSQRPGGPGRRKASTGSPPASEPLPGDADRAHERPGRLRGGLHAPVLEEARQAGGGGLWGLGGGSAVWLGMDYVFLKNLAVQVGWQNIDYDYEFALKWTLLRPTASLPVAVGLRGASTGPPPTTRRRCRAASGSSS